MEHIFSLGISRRQQSEPISAFEDRHTRADNMYDIKEMLSKKNPTLLILDNRWMPDYETLHNESNLPKPPVILTCPMTSLTTNKFRKSAHADLNVIGIMSMKETFWDYSRQDKGSTLNDMMVQIDAYTKSSPDAPLTPDVFAQLKTQIPTPTPKQRRPHI